MLRAVRMSHRRFCFLRHHNLQHGYFDIEFIVVIVLLACVSRMCPISFPDITFDIVNFIVNVDIVTFVIDVVILYKNFILSPLSFALIVVGLYRRDDLLRQCNYHHPSASASSSGRFCCRRCKHRCQRHLFVDLFIVINIVNIFIDIVDIVNVSDLAESFVEFLCSFRFVHGVNHCNCGTFRRTSKIDLKTVVDMSFCRTKTQRSASSCCPMPTAMGVLISRGKQGTEISIKIYTAMRLSRLPTHAYPCSFTRR